MSETTPLASGTINASGDTVEVHLVRPADRPVAERTLPAKRAVVVITWPPAPTVCNPANYGDVAATLCRIFAASSTTLAGLKAGKKL